MTAEANPAEARPIAGNANKAMTHIVGVLTQFAMAFASYPDDLRVEVVREQDHLVTTVFCHPVDTGRMRGAKPQGRIALMTCIVREIADRFQIHANDVRVRVRRLKSSANFAPIAKAIPTLEVVDVPSGRRRFIRPN